MAHCVSTPVINGCSADNFNIFKKYVLDNISVLKSFDIMEYNPLFDKDSETLKVILDILNEIFEIN